MGEPISPSSRALPNSMKHEQPVVSGYPDIRCVLCIGHDMYRVPDALLLLLTGSNSLATKYAKSKLVVVG